MLFLVHKGTSEVKERASCEYQLNLICWQKFQLRNLTGIAVPSGDRGSYHGRNSHSLNVFIKPNKRSYSSDLRKFANLKIKNANNGTCKSYKISSLVILDCQQIDDCAQLLCNSWNSSFSLSNRMKRQSLSYNYQKWFMRIGYKSLDNSKRILNNSWNVLETSNKKVSVWSEIG